MPKVKYLERSVKISLYKKVWGNIEKYCSIYDINREKLAHILHMDIRTVSIRKNKPERLLLCELYWFCDAVHIQIEDLFQ